MKGNYKTDKTIEELERESTKMNDIFRNLSDECREKLLEKAMEFYEEKENRRNPNKK